jgi:hypothetical protein
VVTTGTLSPSATLGSAESKIVVAGCNILREGHTVGFGFDVDGAGVELYGIVPAFESTPPDDVELDFHAISRDSVAHVFHAYAYCLTNVDASQDYFGASELPINVSESGDSVAGCLSGETVVGGGCFITNRATEPAVVSPTSATCSA